MADYLGAELRHGRRDDAVEGTPTTGPDADPIRARFPGMSNAQIAARAARVRQQRGGQVERKETADTGPHVPQEEGEPLEVQRGELTSLGEGSDAQTKFIHWPQTDASGVTLGKGYDIGSRSAETVIAELTDAGMSVDQATRISKGAGLKGDAAGQFVTNNRSAVGEISKDVQTALLGTMLDVYTERARNRATSTTPDGNNLNAAGRERAEGKEAGTYVMSAAEWENLHPAMVELITDLIYQGGYYGWDRVAKINAALKAHDGNHLEQFKAVRTLFTSEYMDTYAGKIGERKLGKGKATFYGQEMDLEGEYRRNTIRLAYLNHVIAALESGQTVVVKRGSDGKSSGKSGGGEEQVTTTPALPDGGGEKGKSSPGGKDKTPAQVPTQTPSQPSGRGGFDHVVEWGESLIKLSQRFGVSVEALKAANPDKLRTWGTVQGFNAGDTITIPAAKGASQKSSSTPTADPTTATEEQQPKEGKPGGSEQAAGPDLAAIAQTIYNALRGTLPGWGAILNAVALVRSSASRLAELRKVYAETYGTALVTQVKNVLARSWFGGVAGIILKYLGEQPGAVDKEKGKGKQAGKEDKAPEPGKAENYLSAEIEGSVGAGGVNKARDVRIVQQNLIHLGYLDTGGEVQKVAGMADDEIVAALSDTIAAIKLYQEYGLGGGADGRVDPGGRTWKNMTGRLEMIQEYSSHTIATQPISPVLASNQWISQFKSDPQKNGDGRGLLDSEKSYPTKKNSVCCWDAAQAMVLQAGGLISHDTTSRIPTLLQQDTDTKVLNKQAELGVKYIDKQLESGKPVMIGVDDGRVAKYNADATTEHFIVIVGKVIKDGAVYYRFFDPGTNWGHLGYNETNLLLLGADSMLSGKSYSGNKDYRMAQVRQNA